MTYEAGITYCFYVQKKGKCTQLSKFDIDNAHGIAPVTAYRPLLYWFNLDKDDRKQTKLQKWFGEDVPLFCELFCCNCFQCIRNISFKFLYTGSFPNYDLAWLWLWPCRCDEITSLNCVHRRVYCSFPQVIYEHGERWWNDIDREQLLIRPPELSGKPSSSHIVAKQEKLAKEIMILTFRSIFVHTSKFSFTYILRHEAHGFTSPPKEGVLRIVIALGRIWTRETW
jgi:hypothetical protein